MADADAAHRRRTVRIQRWLLNPPMKAFVWAGLVPGHLIVETRGRVSGMRRRTVVGGHREGETVWVVAEQGRHAGYVRNIEADGDVRVRIGGRWRRAHATILDDDDAQARLDSFGRDRHAALVRKAGTALLTVRFDLVADSRM